MTGARRDVVLIGVGQLRHNRDKVASATLEPLELIHRAAVLAADDAGLGVDALAGLDAVGVVQVVSWAYNDVATRVAQRVGATGAAAFESGVGGHQPVAVLARLADQVATGDAELALMCGGEAQASLDLLGAGRDPGAATGWSRNPGGPVPFSRETGGSEAMWDLGLIGPTRVYPLWENRLRHDLGQSFAESQAWSAELYADFSRVAASHEAAWNREPVTADAVATVGPRNRMICFPYPLLMNALNRVDQAGAVLLASNDAADRLGVPPAQRIHLGPSAFAADGDDVLERETYGRAPGMERALDAVLEAAGRTAIELDVVDLYSCFPVVPKLGALHLGLTGTGARLTVTGGLTAFGGPHNNYSTHAVVSTVRALRKLRDEGVEGTGLIYAQGEYLTQHAAVVLGSLPLGGPSVTTVPAPTEPRVAVDPTWTGRLHVETYTVEHDRDGAPARGYVIGRTPDGVRSGVRVSKSDAATLTMLESTDRDPIGVAGDVTERDGRRLFSLAGHPAGV